MEYNKNDFQKMNDKKVLHKVRKHWVVVSLAMLMALGGAAAATHVSANADATTSNSNAQSNTQTPKENQGQSLVKSANNNVSAQNNNQAQLNNKQNSSQQNITSQASQLHQRILSNVMANQKPAANNQLGAQQNGQQNAPKVSNHVNAPKVGANQSANGRGLLGERINNSLNDAAANKVTTNVNRRKLALTNPKANVKLGDGTTANPADTTSTMIIHYKNTNSSNREISEAVDSRTTDSSKTFDMSHYLNDLPEGFVLDKSISGYDNVNNYPNSYIGGQHDMTVYVMPSPKAVKGYIRFNYISSDQGTSDNGVTQNEITSSDDTSTPGNDTDVNSGKVLNGYLKDVPTGYYMSGSQVTVSIPNKSGNATTKSYAINGNNFTIPYTANVTEVNIPIKKIVDPNSKSAEGTITYEDATNGNSVVGSTPFREPLNSDVNDFSGTQFKELLPSGYKLYKVDNQDQVLTDNTWQNGDNDVIYVQPDGTNPNVPKAQPGYSFITVNYVDQNSNKLVNQFNLTGKDNAQFNLDDYKNAVPANYTLKSTTPTSLSNFPNKDGQDNVVTMKVALNSTADPNNSNYDASTVQSTKYSSPKIQYVNFSDNTPVGGDIVLSNVPTGSVINYAPYVTNLPNGYVFVNMGPHMTNASNSKVNPEATNGVDPYANVIYVKNVPTTGQQITVNYINQNNRNVKTSVIPSDQVKNQLTQNINITDPDNTGSTVPTGYTVPTDENVMHQVTNQKQSFNVNVYGQPVSHKTTVKKTTTNPDGTTSTTSDSINGVTISMPRYVSDANGNRTQISDYNDLIQNPVAGQEVVVDPTSIAPAGYSTDEGQSPITYQIQNDGSTKVLTPTKNVPSEYNYKLIGSTTSETGKNGQPANPTISDGHGHQIPNPNYPKPTTPPFSSHKVSDGQGHEVPSDYPFAALVAPITVQFVNQKGNPINANNGQKSYQVFGRYNTSINVVDPDGTSEMPTGYHLNGNQNVNYTFTDNPQTANILIAGNTINAGKSGKDANNSGNQNSSDTNAKVPSGATANTSDGSTVNSGTQLKKDQVMIHQIFNSQAGAQSDYKIMDLDGEVGDSYTIAPNEIEGHNLIPSDYHSNSRNQNYTATINANGSLSIPGVQNQTVTYNYDKNDATIYVQYQDNSSYQNIGSRIPVEGEIGTTFPLATYTAKSAFPSGYVNGGVQVMNNMALTGAPTFSEGSNGTNGKTIYIRASQAATVQVQYVDVTANGHTVLKTSQVSGNPGDTYTLPASDTEFVPANYSFDGVVNNATKNGNGQYTAQYGQAKPIEIDVTKNPTTPINANLGTVNIHYINSTDLNDENPADQLMESVATGKVGNTFNYRNYETAPYGYNYVNPTSVDNELTKLTQYPQGTKDIYLHLQRNSQPLAPSYTVHIEYDDINNNNQPVGNGFDVTGDTGTNVNFGKYEQVLPSGYEYMGLGKTYSTFDLTPDGQKETEHILVAKPAPSYGTVTINYINDANNSTMQSDQIVANGKNGSSFDMSTYENSVPVGYSYDSAAVVTGYNGSKPVEDPNGYIDYYNGGNQTLNIHVQKTPRPHKYSTITAIYKDINNHRAPVEVPETGKIGDVFDVSPFEHSCPEGGKFQGVASSIPSFFPQWGDTSKSNTTVTFDVSY